MESSSSTQENVLLSNDAKAEPFGHMCCRNKHLHSETQWWRNYTVWALFEYFLPEQIRFSVELDAHRHNKCHIKDGGGGCPNGKIA